jgi:hypothetical protein
MAYIGRAYGDYDFGDGAYGTSVIIDVDPAPGRNYGGDDYGVYSYGESITLEVIAVTSDGVAAPTRYISAQAEAMSTTSGGAVATDVDIVSCVMAITSDMVAGGQKVKTAAAVAVCTSNMLASATIDANVTAVGASTSDGTASAYVSIIVEAVGASQSDAFFTAVRYKFADAVSVSTSDATAAGTARYSAVELIQINSDMIAVSGAIRRVSMIAALSSNMTANGRYLWEKETVAAASWTSQVVPSATWTVQ